ncbi:MAG: YkgJ family cysteine cluster protein [Candidatus Gastranaerophilaceae bacterium]|nr:YkgJ family cysteine cluster protein [Candidatus Gastranaerophilaceae bacterium]
MAELNDKITKLRKNYREIFVTCGEEIEKRVNELRPENLEGEIFQKYKPDSEGYKWQVSVLELLDNEISKEIYRKLNEILAYRSQFKCIGCATCCKLACSEFSPEELKQKADNGDNFAGQFLSVFVPYKSKEEAEKIYPEYIELLKENGENDVYFYHCPKVTEDNRCSDYENRPQICRDFPDNPLSILPKSCGYNEWKEEIEPIALMLHSMLEITDYYRTKLSELL